MTTKSMSPLLTEQELAEYLKVHVRTLWEWRRNGKGPPFVMIGKRRRYRLSDIEAYAERMRKSPGG